MPPQFKPPPVISETLIVDRYGLLVLTHHFRQFTTFDAQGNMVAEVSQGEMITLVDGTLWSPAMLKANPPSTPGVCDVCRYPVWHSEQPTHGLCSQQNLKICSCGTPTCPRHGRYWNDTWICAYCCRSARVRFDPIMQICRSGLTRFFFREE